MGSKGPRNMSGGISRTKASKPSVRSPSMGGGNKAKPSSAAKVPRNLASRAPSKRVSTKARRTVVARPLPTRAKGKI